MRQDRLQLTRRFGVSASALAAGLFVSGCGGGSAGDPPHQPTAQSITFAAPASQTMGTAPPGLSASASSSLAVTLTSTTTGVCTVNGTTLTLVAPGTCTITAAQAGNSTFAAATPVSQSFTVAAAPLAQTISFPSPGNQTIGTAAPALAAVASSGLTVSYASSTPAVCTASGASTTLTLVAAGTCTITASQSGDATRAAATPVSVTFTVSGALAAQTITFPPPGNQTLGTAPPALSATASSGLSVSYVSTTTPVCTVSGTTLSLVSAGTCSITANQAGDSTHAAAAPVTDTFTVASASVPALTFSSGFASGGLTVEGGGFGGYSGSDLDGWNCSGFCGNGGSFTPTVTADASGFYYYYQTPTPATVGEYVGIYLQAAGVTGALSSSADTAGLQLTTQTTMKFTFGLNPEWFASTTHNVGVLLTLGKHYSPPGGACNIKLLAVFTPTAQAATAYAIPLSAFVVNQDCGVAGLTAASALALSPISQIDFQGDGGSALLTAGGLSTGANMSVPTTGATVVYPTTLVVNGAVTFQ